jgi:hypothetical protein
MCLSRNPKLKALFLAPRLLCCNDGKVAAVRQMEELGCATILFFRTFDGKLAVNRSSVRKPFNKLVHRIAWSQSDFAAVKENVSVVDDPDLHATSLMTNIRQITRKTIGGDSPKCWGKSSPPNAFTDHDREITQSSALISLNALSFSFLVFCVNGRQSLNLT